MRTLGRKCCLERVTGGLASAAFYGAGKAAQALAGSLRSNKSDVGFRNRIGNAVEPMDKTYEMALNPDLYANDAAT